MRNTASQPSLLSSPRSRCWFCRCVLPQGRHDSIRRHRSCRWPGHGSHTRPRCRRTVLRAPRTGYPTSRAHGADRAEREATTSKSTGTWMSPRRRRKASCPILRTEKSRTRVGPGAAQRKSRGAVPRMARGERRASLCRPGVVLLHDDRAEGRRRGNHPAAGPRDHGDRPGAPRDPDRRASACRRPGEVLARQPPRPMGRRHAGRRSDRAERQALVRQRRQYLQRKHAA